MAESKFITVDLDRDRTYHSVNNSNKSNTTQKSSERLLLLKHGIGRTGASGYTLPLFLLPCVRACVCVCVCVLVSRVLFFATPWTEARQAPLSMEFSRQEYWSGWRFSSPGDLPDPGMEPRSPALQADSSPSEPQGKPLLPTAYN